MSGDPINCRRSVTLPDGRQPGKSVRGADFTRHPMHPTSPRMKPRLSPFVWMAAQAQRASAPAAPGRSPFNPRPPGQIVEGSASSIVLRFLKQHRGVSFGHTQLLKHTGCTPSALIWACSFLVREGFIVAVPDAIAGRRRLRYAYTGLRRADDRAISTTSSSKETQP